jgi:hypothetical protein
LHLVGYGDLMAIAFLSFINAEKETVNVEFGDLPF